MFTYPHIEFTEAETLPPVKPTPEEKPTGTFRGLGARIYAVIHDNLNPEWDYRSRGSDSKIVDITNEMYVPRRWWFREDIQEWRVHTTAKISFWPEDDIEWLSYFISGVGAANWDTFNGSGFGWRDRKANALVAWLYSLAAALVNRPVMGIRPEGVAIYNFLLCGGNKIEVFDEFRNYWLFRCQDADKPPSWETYFDNPLRVFKQGITGYKQGGSFYGIAARWSVGDLFLPTACPGGIAAIEKSDVRPLPVPPWDTKKDGYPITVVGYCFRGSETHGLTTEGDWYLLADDRGEYVDGFNVPRAIEVLGWQRS